MKAKPVRALAQQATPATGTELPEEIRRFPFYEDTWPAMAARTKTKTKTQYVVENDGFSLPSKRDQANQLARQMVAKGVTRCARVFRITTIREELRGFRASRGSKHADVPQTKPTRCAHGKNGRSELKAVTP